MLRNGKTVDRYKVVDKIGQGGMASVYLVRHTQLNSLHALKLLFLSGATIRKRLIREGRVQASLRHHNVVAVTDVLDVDGSPALIMEYVDGPVLDQWLVGRKLSVAEALHIFRGVVLAIAHAHKLGVAHRDLKPANILLADTNDGLIPKVTDFGLVKALDGEDGRAATQAGVAMGTPNYMSPEQIRDSATVDKRTDVFALGCILYELIAGRQCFAGETQYDIYRLVIDGDYTPLAELVPGVPHRVTRAIELCLKTERDERLDDCDMLFDMLYDKQSVTVGTDPKAYREDALELRSLHDGTSSSAVGPRSIEPVRVAPPTPPRATPEPVPQAVLRSRDHGKAIAMAATLFVLVFATTLGILSWMSRAGDRLVEEVPMLAPSGITAPPAAAPTDVSPPPVEPAPPPPAENVEPAALAPVRVKPAGPPPVPPVPAPPPDEGKMLTDDAVDTDWPVDESPPRGVVVASGDADMVWLARGRNEFHLNPSADVPAGDYKIRAVFGGRPPVAAGDIAIVAGEKVILNCASFAFQCRPNG